LERREKKIRPDFVIQDWISYPEIRSREFFASRE